VGGWACVAGHAAACRADFLEADQTTLSLHAEEWQNVTSGLTLGLQHHHDCMCGTVHVLTVSPVLILKLAAHFIEIVVKVCVHLVNDCNQLDI
jgi:hypothetical protein